MSDTVVNAITNQKTPCQPVDVASAGQTSESSVMDSGTQVHQRPSAKPRVLSGNQSVMSVGAATPTRPIPKPSMKRPMYMAGMFVPARTGIRPPTMTPMAEIAIVHLRPIFRQMNAAGKARMMPTMDTIVISMPNPAASNMKPPAGLTPGMKMK